MFYLSWATSTIPLISAARASDHTEPSQKAQVFWSPSGSVVLTSAKWTLFLSQLTSLGLFIFLFGLLPSFTGPSSEQFLSKLAPSKSSSRRSFTRSKRSWCTCPAKTTDTPWDLGPQIMSFETQPLHWTFARFPLMIGKNEKQHQLSQLTFSSRHKV